MNRSKDFKLRATYSSAIIFKARDLSSIAALAALQPCRPARSFITSENSPFAFLIGWTMYFHKWNFIVGFSDWLNSESVRFLSDTKPWINLVSYEIIIDLGHEKISRKKYVTPDVFFFGNRNLKYRFGLSMIFNIDEILCIQFSFYWKHYTFKSQNNRKPLGLEHFVWVT